MKARNVQPVGQMVYDETTGDWVAWDGNSSGVALSDTPEFFEDTSFVTGDSPATVDINTALGRNAEYVQVINDGPGAFTIAASNDGAVFGDAITVKASDPPFVFEGLSIDSVRITWVADSAYRVIAV